MDGSNEKDTIGEYIIAHSRLLKTKNQNLQEEKEKNDVIKQIAEQCVPKKFASVLKRDLQEGSSQTEEINEAKRKCFGKRDPAEIKVCEPQPTPALHEAVACLSKDEGLSDLGALLTSDAANLIGGCTRLILRNIIQTAKRTANCENRLRIVPSDVDMAIGIERIDYDLTCPLLKPTPPTDRMFWGRKLTKPHNTIPAISTDIVARERFCDSIFIKDHWLVVEGVQPNVPENVIPSVVKKKFEEEQQETQRLYGFGPPGLKKDTHPEKRVSTQTFSLEHQVLYAEATQILTSGSALERRRVLDCIETDTGIQFLAGRFVVLIAEGVRMHIGTRNIRGLANLMKLTWSLMKNPNIRLEKYLYVLVPSLISCVVSKSMVAIVDSSKTSGLKAKATVPPNASELTDDDKERITRDLEIEFRLRETAGRLLVELSNQYQSQNLNVRVVQLFRKVLCGNHDPAAIYGVLCTFFSFGNLTIRAVVLPKMHDIFCSLQSSREAVAPIKTTMTKMRKIILESEAVRMGIVQNRTIELVMKIIYENEVYIQTKDNKERKEEANPDTYVRLYAEFGALFYNYAVKYGMVNETDGHLKVTRPSLLQNQKSFLLELEAMKKPKKTINPSAYGNQRNLMMNDEPLPEMIMDDSHRPWIKTASQVEEMDQPSLRNSKDTFFREPKLFLVRKEKDCDGSLAASYIRPLEYGHMPTLPSMRLGRKPNDAVRETIGRESLIGQSIYASRASESVRTTNESGELLRKFVNRPDDRAGAIIYGRSMLLSENGRLSLDNEIAKAAAKLSSVRLQNAVSITPSVFRKDDISRGKFLSRPQTLTN